MHTLTHTHKKRTLTYRHPYMQYFLPTVAVHWIGVDRVSTWSNMVSVTLCAECLREEGGGAQQTAR